MNTKIKKRLLLNLPYVLISLYATKIGQAWRMAGGTDASTKMIHLSDGLTAAFQSPWPSFHPVDLCIGMVIGILLWLVAMEKRQNAKKFRKNAEYGSARWGTAEEIKPYIDPKFENNILLTKTERLTMNNRPKNPVTARNKNVLVIGGSGSGKTRGFVKPNLMQCTSKDYPTSFIVTDPKGSVLTECGHLLLREGYRIKVFNTVDFKKSLHYNPLAYVHSEKDILKLVTVLIQNTKGEGKASDDFWQHAETLLYTALIGYLHYEAKPEEQNLATMIDMLSSMETREGDEDFQNPVDQLFELLEQDEPDHFAVRQYKKFKLAAGMTLCIRHLAHAKMNEMITLRKELTTHEEPYHDCLVRTP